MWVRSVELTDIRSYDRERVVFEPGATLLLGANAQGKTNLVEAIYRAACGASHRVAADGPLVRADANQGIIRCEIDTDEGRTRTVELELVTRGRGRTRIDGQDIRRSADGVGVLRAVIFSPEDVAIIRADPEQRRRFLDELLAQRRPAYAVVRSDYDRALRQRNQLLRRVRALPTDAAERASATLEAWTEQLVTLGAQITAARAAAIRALQGPVDEIYRQLSDREEAIGIEYRPTAGLGDEQAVSEAGVPDTAPIMRAMRDRFEAVRDDELRRAATLVGPHRDEVELSVGALPARAYASQGEAWSLALALKLATHELLTEVGDRPIVILDDVFAELDGIRRARLADACLRFDQVLVTAATGAQVPLEGRVLTVRLEEGVSRVRPEDASEVEW